MEVFAGALVFWLICGGGCAAIADAKGRDSLGWFFLGLLLGPIAVLIIGFMPSLIARPSAEPVQLTNISTADEIRKLAELREQGVLTNDEFARQKAKILE